jgi:hypothetical protein
LSGVLVLVLIPLHGEVRDVMCMKSQRRQVSGRTQSYGVVVVEGGVTNELRTQGASGACPDDPEEGQILTHERGEG